jgi:hypothetical protein
MLNVGKVIQFALDLKMLKVFYALSNKGYLYDRGWVKSYQTQKPVSKDGNPVPWVTHSFLDFIAPRLKSTFTIFEYGSGNSTLYYASKVKSVTSVESDEGWFNFIRQKMPLNVSLFYKPAQTISEYIQLPLSQGQKYDIIIVDGLSRYECAASSIQALNDQGVLVLDNSERKEYKGIYETLKKNNFRFIDFWGVAPGSVKNNCTSIFYRDNNCLNI